MSSDPTADASADDHAGGESPEDAAAEEATPCTYTDYVGGEDRREYPATGEDAGGVAADVWDRLYDVDDPEMPVSVVDLGLIYGVDVEAPAEAPGAGETGGAHATVEMTLTYTGCPARKYLTEEIEKRVAGVDGVESVDLRLVWSPPWGIEMVTETGREKLREFGLSV
jgi:metal-sulfur cluster biosynthetic enzyme